MILDEVIDRLKEFGLIGDATHVLIIVNNGDTENLSHKLFECEIPVSEIRNFFGKCKFITSWVKNKDNLPRFTFLVTKGVG